MDSRTRSIKQHCGELRQRHIQSGRSKSLVRWQSLLPGYWFELGFQDPVCDPGYHDAPFEPDSNAGSAGDIRCQCQRGCTAELSMAEKYREHLWRKFSELYDSCDGFRGQWREVSLCRV